MRMVLDSSNWSKFKSSLHSPMCRYDCMSSTCLSPHRLGPPTHATDHASSHDLRYIYIYYNTLWNAARVNIAQSCVNASVVLTIIVLYRPDHHQALSTWPERLPHRSAPTRAAVTRFKPRTYIDVSRYFSQATRQAEQGQGTPLLSQRVLCGPDQLSN